jgi:hypothetical protein
LAWQAWPEPVQLEHLAVIVGPSRLPQMLGLPLDELLVAPPPVPLEPHTLVLGMHTWSCSPFAPATMVQLWSEGHVALLVQVGAQ